MRTMQPSFAAGEIAPALRNRVDLAKYRVGCTTLRNMVVHPQGGASNRAGFEFIGLAQEDSRLIPFVFSAAQAYVLEFGHFFMRVITDGGFVVDPATGEPLLVPTPYPVSALQRLKYAQSADTMFVTHPDYRAHELRRFSNTSWAFVEVNFNPSITVPGNVVGVVEPAEDPAEPYTREILYGVSAVTEEGESRIGTGPTPILSCTLMAEGSVPNGQVEVGTFSPQEHGVSVGDIVSVFYWGEWYGPLTVATVEDAFTFRASGYPIRHPLTFDGMVDPAAAGTPVLLPEVWEVGTRVDITWDAVPGALFYNVYKNARGQWGWIGSPSGNSFVDDNIEGDVSYGPKGNPVYSFANNPPGAVALFQQRLMLARSNERPTTLWASRLGHLPDFTISDPLRDDDPIEAAPANGRVDEIKHLVPFDGLVVFTSGAEWLMNGDGSGLSPTNINFRIQSYNGSADYPPPLVVDKSVLFCQRSGRSVRDLFFAQQYDSYAGNDLSIMSSHLMAEFRIADWTYQSAPDSIVWAVREDGALLSMTYQREHEVFAWSRHDTAGEFKGVCAVPAEGGDDVYAIVDRSSLGITVIGRSSGSIVVQASGAVPFAVAGILGGVDGWTAPSSPSPDVAVIREDGSVFYYDSYTWPSSDPGDPSYPGTTFSAQTAPAVAIFTVSQVVGDYAYRALLADGQVLRVGVDPSDNALEDLGAHTGNIKGIGWGFDDGVGAHYYTFGNEVLHPNSPGSPLPKNVVWMWSTFGHWYVVYDDGTVFSSNPTGFGTTFGPAVHALTNVRLLYVVDGTDDVAIDNNVVVAVRSNGTISTVSQLGASASNPSYISGFTAFADHINAAMTNSMLADELLGLRIEQIVFSSRGGLGPNSHRVAVRFSSPLPGDTRNGSVWLFRFDNSITGVPSAISRSMVIDGGAASIGQFPTQGAPSVGGHPFHIVMGDGSVRRASIAQSGASASVQTRDTRPFVFVPLRDTIERLSRRDARRFLDSHLHYSGAPATTISGLEHLEGATVTAIADGEAVEDLTVTGGGIVLPDPASEVTVGLPYESDLETLELDLTSQEGSNQGLRQRVGEVIVRVLDSRGIEVGPDYGDLVDARIDDTAGEFTGDVPVAIPPSWGRAAKVCIRQSLPYPMTILGVIPDVKVGG